MELYSTRNTTKLFITVSHQGTVTPDSASRSHTSHIVYCLEKKMSQQEQTIEDVITCIIAPMLAINQPTIRLIEYESKVYRDADVFHMFVNNTNIIKRLHVHQMAEYITTQLSGIEGLRVLVIMPDGRFIAHMMECITSHSPPIRVIKRTYEQLVLAPKSFSSDCKRYRDFLVHCSRVIVVPPNAQCRLRGQSADMIIYKCTSHREDDSCHFTNMLQKIVIKTSLYQ